MSLLSINAAVLFRVAPATSLYPHGAKYELWVPGVYGIKLGFTLGFLLTAVSALCRREGKLTAACDNTILQEQSVNHAAAMDSLISKHTSEIDQLVVKYQQREQEADARDAQRQSKYRLRLEAQQADSKAALQAQAASQTAATQRHQAQLEQQFKQQQQDEQIRARQAHSQHARILDEWKSHSQRALDAQAATYASTVAGLTQRRQRETAKLEQQIEKQAADHGREVVQLRADRDSMQRELNHDAACSERILLRSHKTAMEAKDKILAQTFQLLQDQTSDKNR